MIKLDWLERVKKTEEAHRGFLRENSNHTVKDTADKLRRSYGSVNEDLQLASWLKSHPKIADFVHIQDALRFIRDKKKEMKLL